MGRLSSWIAPVACILAAFPAMAEKESPNGVAEVRRHELGSGALAGTGYELVLPGRLVSWSPECSDQRQSEGAESCGVYVLTRWKRDAPEGERSSRPRDRTERYSVCLFRPGS